MRRHPVIGAELLAPLRTMSRVVPIVRHHHERWDGGGYPDGLRGERIPLLARVFQVLDAFDALTSKRAYREPMTAATTLEYLRAQSGRLLEPRIYDALLAVVQSGIVEGIPRVK